MIEELKRIEREALEVLMSNPDDWQSLDVDYHPPKVERVWRTYGSYRISLHVIHPCKSADSLIHPHPWKSAVHVFETGSIYEHGICYPDGHMKTLCKHEVMGEMYYEILEKQAYHWVRPINGLVYSVMLMGPTEWEENNIKADKQLVPLSDERKKEIIGIFHELYIGNVQY